MISGLEAEADPQSHVDLQIRITGVDRLSQVHREVVAGNGLCSEEKYYRIFRGLIRIVENHCQDGTIDLGGTDLGDLKIHSAGRRGIELRLDQIGDFSEVIAGGDTAGSHDVPDNVLTVNLDATVRDNEATEARACRRDPRAAHGCANRLLDLDRSRARECPVTVYGQADLPGLGDERDDGAERHGRRAHAAHVGTWT